MALKEVQYHESGSDVALTGVYAYGQAGSVRVLCGAGPIYALATTESVTVPVDAVLWLDDESAA